MSNENSARKQDNAEVGPQAEVTLAQLAASIAQLQQQIQEVNRRLDMVYGAVNRLAESNQDSQPPVGPKTRPEHSQAGTPSASLNMAKMMDPGSMLDSLRQYAVDSGLNVSADMVDRLKSGLPQGE